MSKPIIPMVTCGALSGALKWWQSRAVELSIEPHHNRCSFQSYVDDAEYATIGFPRDGGR